MDSEFKRGWPALLGGMFGNFSGIGGLLYFGLSSFMKPLQTQFGWSRVGIGFAISCFTLGSIVSLPIVGRLCDRHGPRKVILPSIPVAAALICSLTLLRGSIWELYVAYFLITVLGAGTAGVTYANLISGWFDRHRGLAIGIILTGGGLSAFAMPIILHWVIGRWGWRIGWFTLALIMVVQFPVAYLTLRESPIQTVRLRSGTPARSGDLWRVLTSPSFWKITLPFFLISATIVGITINLVVLLIDRGIPDGFVAKIASLVGIGVILARLSIGLLLDRIQARYAAALVFFTTACGCIGLLQASTIVNAGGAFLLGCTMGAELDILAFMSSRYFGLSRQGLVFGAGMSVVSLGAMLSPAIIGALYRQHGNYDRALQLTIILCVAAAAIILTLATPPRFEPALSMDAVGN
jgi:MFS family permease